MLHANRVKSNIPGASHSSALLHSLNYTISSQKFSNSRNEHLKFSVSQVSSTLLYTYCYTQHIYKYSYPHIHKHVKLRTQARNCTKVYTHSHTNFQTHTHAYTQIQAYKHVIMKIPSFKHAGIQELIPRWFYDRQDNKASTTERA